MISDNLCLQLDSMQSEVCKQSNNGHGSPHDYICLSVLAFIEGFYMIHCREATMLLPSITKYITNISINLPG